MCEGVSKQAAKPVRSGLIYKLLFHSKLIPHDIKAKDNRYKLRQNKLRQVQKIENLFYKQVLLFITFHSYSYIFSDTILT